MRFDLGTDEEDVRVNLHLEVDQCGCQGECIPTKDDMALLHSRYAEQLPSTSKSFDDVRQAITDITKNFFTELVKQQ